MAGLHGASAAGSASHKDKDRYGHQVGDEVLRAFSASVAGVLAAHGLKDILSRIGGEEFAVMVPFNAGNAHAIAQDMRRAIKAMRFSAVSGLSCTASIGIAEALVTDMLKSLMKRSDLALYEAKRQGRDRVVSFNVALHLEVQEPQNLERCRWCPRCGRS